MTFESINKLVLIYTMKYYRAIKMNEFQTTDMTWEYLTNMVSKTGHKRLQPM